jgi:hypothetical protein
MTASWIVTSVLVVSSLWSLLGCGPNRPPHPDLARCTLGRGEATTATDEDLTKLEPSLRSAGRRLPIRVVLDLAAGMRPENTTCTRVVRVLEKLPRMTVEVLGDRGLYQLAHDPAVVHIWEDRRAKLVETAESRVGAYAAVEAGLSGKGTSVAVLDTGIDDLTQDAFGTCSAPGSACCAIARDDDIVVRDDCIGRDHGRKVSAVVARAAPGAKILSLNVSAHGFITPDCSPGTDTWSAAIDWVLLNRDAYNIVAVNISASDGGSYLHSNCPGDMDAPLSALRDAGIAPIVASGNDSHPSGIGWPACSPFAISVASVRGGQIGSESNLSPELLFLAPIDGAGTSLAAPMVAAAFADIKQAKPALTVDEIVSLLQATGVPLARAGAAQTWPEIRIDRALELLALGDRPDEGDRFGASTVAGDFNGDGRLDIAIGAPGSVDARGAIQIVYAASDPTLYRSADDIYIDSAALGTSGKFGAALEAADFNHDGFADLAVGAPNAHTIVPEAGAVVIINGSSAGLDLTHPMRIVQADLPGSEGDEQGDHFGASLAAGDFNCDEIADLAIGVPNEDFFLADGQTFVTDAGQVSVVHGSANGLALTGAKLFDQSMSGMRGTPENNDRYGETLAAGDFNSNGCDDLVIGAPGENVTHASGDHSVTNAGAVYVVYSWKKTNSGGLTTGGNQSWKYDQFVAWAEGHETFGASLAVADYDNDSKADLAIGAPGGDDGKGMVGIVYGASRGLKMSATSSPKTVIKPDGNERVRFGASLAAGDFDGDGLADLAVSAPETTYGEIDMSTSPHRATLHSKAGAVIVYENQGKRKFRKRKVLDQVDNEIADRLGPEHPEDDDEFGSVLGAADLDKDGYLDLIVATPNEDVEQTPDMVHDGCALQERANSGLANIVFGSDHGLWAHDLVLPAEECWPNPCPTSPPPDWPSNYRAAITLVQGRTTLQQ